MGKMNEMIKETISEFCLEKDIDIEEEEIDELLDAIKACFEYASYSVASFSSSSEVDRLKRELEKERSKIICSSCKGSGVDTSYGPAYVATSRCSKCGGTGKVSP